MENILLNLDAIFYMFGSVVAIDMIRRIDRFLMHRKPASDEEYLAFLAFRYQVSEYDLFFYAAKEWALTSSRVEADFKDYLIREKMPYYVRDFVRRERKISPVSG